MQSPLTTPSGKVGAQNLQVQMKFPIQQRDQ